MAVPSSGQLCLLGIAREKYSNLYTNFLNPPISPASGYELSSMAVGNQYGTINTDSSSYPDGAIPHCMSEWYGYDHDAFAPSAGTWRTMSPTTVSATTWVSSAGTVPAAMVSQGRCTTSPYVALSCTQEFDGTSWSVGGNNVTARKGINNSAIGTQNAALAFGGCVSSPACQTASEYNGSTWANANSVPTRIKQSATGGIQNSAIFAGGCTPISSRCVREYNGFSWSTASSILGSGQFGGTGVGTQNAFLVVGGSGGTYFCNTTREYNGTTWSSGPNISTQRAFAAGAGNQNDAKVAGGLYCYNGPILTISSVEDYNGTSWVTGTSLPNCRQSMASGGTTTCMWAVGGCAAGIGFCTDGYIWD